MSKEHWSTNEIPESGDNSTGNIRELLKSEMEAYLRSRSLSAAFVSFFFLIYIFFMRRSYCVQTIACLNRCRVVFATR